MKKKLLGTQFILLLALCAAPASAVASIEITVGLTAVNNGKATLDFEPTALVDEPKGETQEETDISVEQKVHSFSGKQLLDGNLLLFSDTNITPFDSSLITTAQEFYIVVNDLSGSVMSELKGNIPLSLETSYCSGKSTDGKTATPDKTNFPATGDNTNIALLLAVMAVALCCIFILKRPRK